MKAILRNNFELLYSRLQLVDQLKHCHHQRKLAKTKSRQTVHQTFMSGANYIIISSIHQVIVTIDTILKYLRND